MKLSIISNDPVGVALLSAEGNVTAIDFVTEGRNPLQEILGEDWASRKVLVDLDGVDFLDSRAIAWLIGTHKAFRSAGGNVVFHSPTPAVRQLLDMLRVGKVVHLAESESAARAMV